MTDKAQHKKRPRDTNQLAKSVVDVATSECLSQKRPTKDAAAVELGRKGGLIGGKARARRLAPDARSAIAKKAASARWGKKNEDAKGE